MSADRDWRQIGGYLSRAVPGSATFRDDLVRQSSQQRRAIAAGLGHYGCVDWVRPDPVASHSAVLVPVAEAERVVGRHRARLDRSAAWGVPAHVTVLYPFVAPPAISAATIAVLADAVGPVSAFDCEFFATGWFGEEAVWLAPRPSAPFRALTQAVSAAFPGYLPYGGAYDDVLPHLTVGATGSVAELRAAQAEVMCALPIRARISGVWLMTGTTAPGSWRAIAKLPLAGD